LPTWGQVLYELNKLLADQQRSGQPPDPFKPSPYDVIRRKYLEKLTAHTGRPVIVYASGWLEGRPIPDPSVVSVSTRDMMGFMEAVHGLPSPGPLDLILHSPGGDADAAQAIMSYLRDQGFDPIRAIVPISAMSAATMMALSCNEILMGRHSQLGPIDPQFTLQTPDGPRGAPAQAILDQFDMAKTECGSTPQALAAWLPILRSYGPGLLSQCLTAQDDAEKLVAASMAQHMFSDLPPADAANAAKAIAAWFNDHKQHRSHGRPLRYDEVAQKGVRVTLLEADNTLQDKVLSAWHGVQISLSQVAVNKVIENAIGGTWMLSGSPGVILMGGPPGGQGPAPQSPAPRAPGSTPPQPGPNRAQRRHPGR
jgi:hypothetical protein